MALAQTGKHPSPEQHKHEIEAQRKMGSPCKCLETGEEYGSIIEASEATGIPYDHLRGVLKGDRMSTHGTHWVYAGKNRKDAPQCRNGIENHQAKPVYCVELQKMYGTMKEAAEDVSMDIRRIRKVCKGRQESSGGYHWRYATEQERKELKENDSTSEGEKKPS